jgi:methanogenic corrinoid protein MtbC1
MYNIKQAAARSGMRIPTLRAWERRYGIVHPTRTSSGYRLYDDAAIRRLIQMRRLVDSGWRAREAAAEVVAGRAADVPDEPATESAMPVEEAPAIGQVVDDFLVAVKPYHSAAIQAALDEAFSVAAFEPAMERMVFPALREVGRRWETGDLEVSAEHAASHAVLRRLAMLFDAVARPADRHEAVVGLPPGAQHDLGALAFAVAAMRSGVNILYLGADVPVDSWVAALQDTGARFAVIGVPTAADVSAATEVARALNTSRPGVTVAVGGAGTSDLTDDIGPNVVRLPPDLGAAALVLKERLDAGRR